MINRPYIQYFLALMLVAMSSAGYGQEKLAAVIFSDTTLAKGTYIVEDNVLVGKDAVLRFSPGSKLIIREGRILKVEGGLEFMGAEKGFAEITSESPNKRGKGLLIASVASKSILLKRVKFSHLVMPLEFEADWHRPNVTIEGCEFIENEGYMPGIFVRIPDDIETTASCNFTFIKNSFVDNIGGIYFEDIGAYNLNIVVKNNFIYGNRAYGAGLEGLLTSPFFVRYGGVQPPKNFEMSHNALIGNYIKDHEYDTTLQQVNMGAGGDASSIKIPNNYWGKGSDDQKARRMDHFSNNSDAPILYLKPELQRMPEGMPAIVESLEINSKKVVPNDPDFVVKPQENMQMTLAFSGPVDVSGSKPSVYYEAFDTTSEKVVKGELKSVTTWEGDKKVRVSVSDAILGQYKYIFFTFKGFKNRDNFSVPSYVLGENGHKRHMAKNFSEGLSNINRKKNPGTAGFGEEENPFDMAKIDSILNELNKIKSEQDVMKEKLTDQEVEVAYMKQFRGSFQYGLFIGQSIYFGDLTGNDFIDPQDASFAFGGDLGYNLSNRWSIGGSFLYGHLKGQEADNVYRSTAFPDRGFQFDSPLYEISFNAEYNLSQIGVLSERARFTPAISFGVGAFMFDPYVMYEHPSWSAPKRISLRDYHVAGLDEPIPGYSWCVPFGFHLKTIVKRRFMLDLFVSWRYTFTDMLDNVGAPSYYVDEQFFIDKFQGADPIEGVSKAEIAFDLHDSNTPERYYQLNPDEPVVRGGFNNNDWYMIWGIKFSHIALKKKTVQKGI